MGIGQDSAKESAVWAAVDKAVEAINAAQNRYMGCVFEHGAEPGVLSNLSMVAMHTVLTMYGTEPKEVWPAEPGRPLTTQRLLHLQHLEPPDEDTDEPAGDNPGSRVFILGNGSHWICVRAVNGDEDFQEDRPDWVLHDNLERTSNVPSFQRHPKRCDMNAWLHG